MSPASETSAAGAFDEFVDTYEEACGRGLALSGESRDYFARQRAAHTKRLCAAASPRRVLDFGCGLGHSTPYLAEAFPEARIIGVDTSAGALEAARRRYGSERAEFVASDADLPPGSVDIVYSNGTFHHIEPHDRQREVKRIVKWLAPGGRFVLWENNPWNPGTRLVMKRIPFDRDAKTLSCLNASRLLRQSGLQIRGVSFYFYFPSWLKPLRRLEPRLESVPLGAQYCVVAQAPA
jgi:SAM-dependent methyltransferase